MNTKTKATAAVASRRTAQTARAVVQVPAAELRLLELIEVKNTVLFVRGLSRKDRKNILRGVVLHARADRVATIGGLI